MKKQTRFPIPFFIFSSLFGFALAWSVFISPSWAKQIPRALGTDQRIRHVVYSPNEVYEIQATYGFQTTIEFSDQETIQVASIGDSIAWQVIPVGSRLFLKPVEQNPRTNLTIVTNKRTYYFSLLTTRQKFMGSTYLVRFEYPSESGIQTSKTGSQPVIKATSPAEYNFNYELKKDKKSGLLRAFDNGEFTYLQFKNLTDLPAVFLIDEEKKESLVNYRIEGPYVVIERVANEFIFRRVKIVGQLKNKSAATKEKNASSFSQGGAHG